MCRSRKAQFGCPNRNKKGNVFRNSPAHPGNTLKVTAFRPAFDPEAVCCMAYSWSFCPVALKAEKTNRNTAKYEVYICVCTENKPGLRRFLHHKYTHKYLQQVRNFHCQLCVQFTNHVHLIFQHFGSSCHKLEERICSLTLKSRIHTQLGHCTL